MNKRVGLRALPVTLLCALSACTTLEVDRYQSSGPPARGGYAYMLDFTQYQIVIKRTLVACKDGEVPSIKIEPTIATALAPDGDHVYVIDPKSLISAFKTSDISIDYKDGRLVAFNASTVDKTGDFIASVVTTAGKIAMLAAVPVPVGADAGFSYCTDTARNNLKFIEDNKKPLEKATVQLEEANARLALLTSQFAVKPTNALRRQIEDQTKAIKDGKDKVDGLTKSVAKAQAWLTDTMTITWPETATQFHKGPVYPLPVATLDKWFQIDAVRAQSIAAPEAQMVVRADGDVRRIVVAGRGGSAARLQLSAQDFVTRYPLLAEGVDYDDCRSKPDCAQAIAEAQGAMAERIFAKAVSAAVSLHIVRRGSYGGETLSTASGRPEDGLRYRVPAAGTLFICDFDDPCHTDGISKPVSETQGAVAQLGAVFYIPFSSPAFASGQIGVIFDEQGRLLKAQLKRESATALGYANAASTTVDQATGLVKALQQEELNALNRQTELAKAQKTLADAQGALTRTPQQLATDELTLLQTQQQIQSVRDAMAPSPTKDLTTQLNIAQVEVQLAEARAKLQSDPQADLEEVKAQYEAETAVLNARKAGLEAEAALLEAERKLEAARSPR